MVPLLASGDDRARLSDDYWNHSVLAIHELLSSHAPVVLGSVLNPTGWIARFLELAPLRYIGRISYSLYLWQQMFFVGHFYGHFPLGWFESTPLRFVALGAAAMASYHLLERPMMRLGRRLAPPATEGRI